MKRIMTGAVLMGALISLSWPVSSPRLAWKCEGPANPDYEWVTMTAAGGGSVFTIRKGKTWDFSTENGAFKETGSEILALDLSTGRNLWSYPTQFPVLSPLLFLENKLIIHDGYGNLFCLNASTGTEIWTISRELHPGPWTEVTLPAGGSGKIYLREGNELVSRGLKDGKILWQTPIEAVSNRRVFPALSGSKIVLSTAGDEALGFSAEDGRILWRNKLGWMKETVISSENYAFLSNDELFKCVALADGKDVWAYNPPPLKSAPDKSGEQNRIVEPIWNLENAAPLAASGDRIYLIQKRVMGPQNSLVGYEIACLNMIDKRPIWAYPPTEKFSGFSLAGQWGIIVQGSKVVLLRLAEGTVAWEFPVPGEERLQGQALAAGGKILVVGSKGLYVIETGDPSISGWLQCEGGASRSGRGE